MRPSTRRRSGHAWLAAAPTPPFRVARIATLAALAVGGAALAVVVLGADDATPATVALADTPVARDTSGVPERLRATASRAEARQPLVRTVSLTTDGATSAVSTTGTTVADVLAGAGVELGLDDQITPALAEPVGPDTQVVVARVTYSEGAERREIPFDRVERRDDSLDAGVREVQTRGVPGAETVVYRARLVDGAEVSREEVLRAVVAPVDEVVRVGTRVVVREPAPQAATAPRSSGGGGGGGSSASSSGPATGPVVAGDPRSIGRTLAAARGWGEDQFACLDRLWTKESNWNPRAQNRSSGAYGIPQALPGSKMGTVAADWRTNPTTQITWGLNYIAGRYGTPCGAWAHSQARNWY